MDEKHLICLIKCSPYLYNITYFFFLNDPPTTEISTFPLHDALPILLQFRSVGLDTPLAPAERNIFAILGHLAAVQPLPIDSEQRLISELASNPEIFKIIVTSQPRGFFPHAVWSTSYIVFLD